MEKCILCGMTANYDPWAHEGRYGHIPEIRRGNIRMRHDGRGVFVPVDDSLFWEFFSIG